MLGVQSAVVRHAHCSYWEALVEGLSAPPKPANSSKGEYQSCLSLTSYFITDYVIVELFLHLPVPTVVIF